MSHLIVNADDFGLTAGINRAISELHRDGVLTSATMMASAAATDEAIEIARAAPSLGVGCHVVLVDGKAMLPPGDDGYDRPDLNGTFRSSLFTFLSWLYSRESASFPGAERSRTLEAEAAAQIALLHSRGVRLTHVDTHKHTHMFPAVLRPVLRAARAAGIRAVRNPFEPMWSLRATPDAPWIRRAEVTLLRGLEPAFRRIVAEEGFVTTDGAIGVLATGTLDASSITSLLRAMPAGTWELVTHPGYNDSDLAQVHTRLLASRETEREALNALRNFPGVELKSFAELAARVLTAEELHLGR